MWVTTRAPAMGYEPDAPAGADLDMSVTICRDWIDVWEGHAFASREACHPPSCLTMVFKLMESTSKTSRALNGCTLLADVIAGVKFAHDTKRTAA